MFVSCQSWSIAFPLIVAVLFGSSSLAHGSRNRPLSDMLGVSAAVQMYEVTTGCLPHPEDGLQVLVSRPPRLPEGTEWDQLMDKIPSDPWGNRYLYVAGEGYPGGFGLYSLGADGRSSSQGNDPDDWNTWSEDGRGGEVESDLDRRRIVALAVSLTVLGFSGGYVVGGKRRNVR